MSPIDVLRTALGSLRSNKLRSVLTLLGIIIGITAVTVLMTIGRGVQRGITAQIEAQGTNLLFVSATYGGPIEAPPPPEGVPTSAFFSRLEPASPLTIEDAYALLDPVLAPSVKTSVPYKSIGAEVVPVGGPYQSAWASSQVGGVTPEYARLRNIKLEQGEFINSAHMKDRALVAVIDESMAESLFTTRNPVGQPVRINGRLFTVIGVREDTGFGFFGGSGETVLIPITTALYRMGEPSPIGDENGVDTIYAEAVSPEVVNDAREEIRVILRLAPPAHGKRRLRDRDAPRAYRVPQPDNRGVRAVPGHHSRNLASGRRDRCYEHHAGLGYGADAGDRHTQGHGGEEAGRAAPVRGGGRASYDRRRGHRAAAEPVSYAGHQPAGRRS